jgi:pimeloyl-ACP methyl ester carboxylesterase
MNDRQPLLLIHGFTDTARTWDPLVPLLAGEYDLIVPTLLGHRGGNPLPTPLGRPLDALVTDLERTLDGAGHHTAHIVGNSLGGWLAFELAARGRARSVLALSPGQGWEGDTVPQDVARRFARTNRLAPLGSRMAETLAARPGLRKIALRDVIAHPERVPPSTAVELIRGAADCPMYDPWVDAAMGGDFRSDLEPIDVPIRIAWGSRDRTLPFKTCSAHFRSALPAAEWVELPDCGHLPQHDDPQLVARHAREVIASH